MDRPSESSVCLSVSFAGLTLSNPVFLASGTSGYADELGEFMNLDTIGGLITKSITLLPRPGNSTPRIVETDAGMLNAIGLANIGVEVFIQEKVPILESLQTTVFVNVAGQSISEYLAVIDRLAPLKAIDGFELNISCPNVKEGGITFGTDPAQVEQITRQAKKSSGSKPLMVKLTPSVTDIAVTARAAIEGGADALSLVNTFTAMVIDIESRKPVLANRTGGLSGPAIKPIAVYLVHKVYTEAARPAGIPLLGMGGIRTASDAVEFLLAGASAVAVGTATFVQPDAAARILAGLETYCREHHISHISELTGGLQ
ncbi:MAG TPA: dihydroorotate dehydrogenase [Anaerohalosphaeraceae bacterium]|nr:dihydroorotate dehydrogenase [Anaerohalosphaeraceae bacterium]HQG05230.1 dihydroorotate dehydrogenase [Anaerohalosphaeraceae bacterium]HQI06948.1 dihydroorotate dehydrogenase [Anaerohalosphaeraceae bacterium]HQJ66644.1 dihydroorotate dehydrogenase [Anaerohalosphaeraceae bacterium]